MFVGNSATAHISNLESILKENFEKETFVFDTAKGTDKVLQAAKVTTMKKQSTRTQKYPFSVINIDPETEIISKSASKARFLEFL